MTTFDDGTGPSLYLGGDFYAAGPHQSYNIVKDPVHIHDMNATILHCLGINHEQMTFPYQGRDFRITDVHGNVISALLI